MHQRLELILCKRDAVALLFILHVFELLLVGHLFELLRHALLKDLKMILHLLLSYALSMWVVSAELTLLAQIPWIAFFTRATVELLNLN